MSSVPNEALSLLVCGLGSTIWHMSKSHSLVFPPGANAETVRFRDAQRFLTVIAFHLHRNIQCALPVGIVLESIFKHEDSVTFAFHPSLGCRT